jgi:hypothetical protein
LVKMSGSQQQEVKARSRKRKFNFEAPTEDQRKKWDEAFKRIEEETEERIKHYDPVVEDRMEIEQQLQSGAAVFVLECSKSRNSHCRAQFCLPNELRGIPKIESNYRLNLKDSTGQRTGHLPHWRREMLSLFLLNSN